MASPKIALIGRAKPILFRDGWQKIFAMSDIREQVRDITNYQI